MAKKPLCLVCIVALLIASGCASMRAVPMDPLFWQAKDRRVGVALGSMPEAEVVINAAGTSVGYGRPIILSGDAEYTEHPLRLHETWALRQASKGMKAQEFEAVQDLLVKGLTERGSPAFKVEQAIDENTLSRFSKSDGEGVHGCRDYRDLGKSVGADYLIVVDLKQYGTMCRYIDLNNYEVEVYAGVRAQMIETATNRILWRNGLSEGRFTRTVNADCSRPDHIPIILDGLKTILGDAAMGVSKQFFSSCPVPGNGPQQLRE